MASKTRPAPEWWFYHLERSPLEQAAGPLLAKCLEKGWRVLAVSESATRRSRLDAGLWTYDEQGFLPHGRADDDGLDPHRQPVLITETLDNANGADAAFLLDGTEAPPNAPFKRCMVMFDGGDDPVRKVARLQFKAAKDAGLVCRYFQQTPNGGWKEAGK
ncbi:MAG: DNA polymerase III subunit chi [Pseudomonadota bacterium]